MNFLKYVSPCHFGLESVLAGELKRMGANNVVAHNGKVTFSGDYSMMARANINLRTAERVLIELGSFKACTFDELFTGTQKIQLESFIGSKDAFPVKGWSLNSQLRSIPDCQSIIKKALVERMKKHYHMEWFPETGAVHQIQFSIHNDEVTIMLDTTGPGLHKRGYRVNSNAAPIKETLAAGIIDLARVRDRSVFYDPFCGSGTFVIEAAMKALNIPPCLKRKFAAQNYPMFEPQLWAEERTRALDLIKRDAEFFAYGSDIDPLAVELTKENAKKAGVFSKILVTQKDIVDFDMKSETGIICCNPPYGERMLELQQAEEIYKKMGRVFEETEHANIYIISPSEKFENIYGKKATKRRKLYNGMIKCQLYMYFNKM
ncbi:class I SAM-dependent RNA methyltransferase [Paludicola sp. MB14-C6]|uniref:THUMP domain-containing class I SAM-dependent RNA methyltransferase n=1 Tax=Paludihabitans sp. MB14-C6 TaxID=3070656 RepID=UPI0027DB9A26|nr:class I SAM-dependent RNA methyltransferase [Paludicola sp. MB14-C6]WMJ22958.1 class I SAM-dependent RNA methyltransferase [Paludicola sp. MB14-C6]